MKTTRYMTLAAVLLGLVAVAPARADASKTELQKALFKPFDTTVRANMAAKKMSATYGGFKIQVVNSTKQSASIVKELHAGLNKPGPVDRGRLARKTKFSIRQLEFAIELAEVLEEEADDRDDDTGEARAKEIRSYLKSARSYMRDFFKLID